MLSSITWEFAAIYILVFLRVLQGIYFWHKGLVMNTWGSAIHVFNAAREALDYATEITGGAY